MKVLAEAGADIFNADENGNNALHLACRKQNLEILELVLDSGYPTELVNQDDMTAFQIAAFCGSLEIIKKMIEHPLVKYRRLMNKLNMYQISSLGLSILNDKDECSEYLIR